MAAGLRCPWVAAYVDSSTLERQPESDRARLEAHLRLAESLGGTAARLSGARVSDAVLAYARRHNVTRIIVGKPTHSRLRDRVQGSLLDELVRGSGDVDVHVISGDESTEPPARARPAPSRASPPAHYAFASAIVTFTLGAAGLLRWSLSLPDPEMLFLLAVLVTAVRFGRGPSLFAAGLGVAYYDFFFVTPYYTFAVADRRYLLTFVMMFAVGLVVSELAGRLKRQEQDALAREERTGVLYGLSRELAAATVPADIAAVAVRHAAEQFDARAVLLQARPDGGLAPLGPAEFSVEGGDLGVARWALEHLAVAGLGTDTLPGSAILCAPLRVGPAPLGVLVLAPQEKRPLSVEQRAFLDVFCGQVAVSLEHFRLAEEARAAAVRAKAEEMRSSLLSTISHDLRTPLASITGAATSLRDDANLDAETRADLVRAICDEAERLERLVSNLLDMTRLAAGALALKRDWVPVDEVVGSALTRLEDRLGDRPVRVALAEGLPLVSVDPVLLEQVFVNLFENVAKYTPGGSAIEIDGAVQDGAVVLVVRDHGPGLKPGDEEAESPGLRPGP